MTQKFRLLQNLPSPVEGRSFQEGEIKTAHEWAVLLNISESSVIHLTDWFEAVEEEEKHRITREEKHRFTEQDMIQFGQAAVHADRATRDVYGRMPVYLEYWVKKHKN